MSEHGCQEVRLPLEFRFDVSEVFTRHDAVTGDMVPSRKPTDWQRLLDAVAQNKGEALNLERRTRHSDTVLIAIRAAAPDLVELK